MRKYYIPAVLALGAVTLATSCKKKDENVEPSVKAYTVPTKYEFSNANFTSSNQRIKMAVELDAYLKTANTGSALVALDQNKANNMWNNANNPFADATLNAATTINLPGMMDQAALYKSYVDSLLMYNTGATASAGTGGFVPRGTNKIIVGPRGMEYGQAYIKGIMGSLFFKEAVKLLTSIKTMQTKDTAAAQAAWDQAFGYLAVPADYDSSVVYQSTNANRPLLWGGYLAERGKSIQAGGTIFAAFLKGRAAIGGYDKNTRDAQIDIIISKWEQLSAAAALHYVTAPTASSAIGNYGTQLHALSEGFGFILALQYRPSNSKLSAADFATLKSIINTDFYQLVNQSGFTDLVKAQNILKTAYGL